MKKRIPLTGTHTDVGVISPEHQRFLSSLNRAMEKTLASGKIKIRPHGERQEPKPEPLPAPVAKAPPRRAPPARPAFKRPTALTK